MTTVAGTRGSPARGRVRALVRARWRMIRPAGARPLLAVPVLLLLAAPLVAIWVGSGLPRNYVAEAALLLPAAITGLLVTSVLSPMLVGGGFELIPDSQLTAYPLRPRTRVDSSLLLAPLNLAWSLQTCALAAATAYVAEGPLAPWVPGLLVILLAATLSVLGHAAAWLLLGWARTPWRRAAAAAVVAAVVTVAVLRLRELALVDVAAALGADRLAAVLGTAAERAEVAAAIAAGLVVVAVVAHEVAVAACGWSLRRQVVRLARDDDRPVRRRSPGRSPLADLVAVDRAGVWRSVPLRRGALVIGITPGVLALLAPLDGAVLTLLPPLVATGAALLFPINAFCLDGSGALWRASLPGQAGLALSAKARVSTEVVLGAVLVTVACGLVRMRDPLTVAGALAIAGSAVGCVALVVTRALRWSVTRPYRADLRGPRDTPAPPGTLAWYSARLAVIAAVTGTAYGVCLQADSVPGVLVVSLLVAAASAWSWAGTRRRWRDPRVRARVASTVATG
ncbi:MAG: hypothetical protein R2737_04550 [Candidatus Nanopelagicales bacterium]